MAASAQSTCPGPTSSRSTSTFAKAPADKSTARRRWTVRSPGARSLAAINSDDGTVLWTRAKKWGWTRQRDPIKAEKDDDTLSGRLRARAQRNGQRLRGALTREVAALKRHAQGLETAVWPRTLRDANTRGNF